MFQASHGVFKCVIVEMCGTYYRAGWHIRVLQLGVAA